MKGLIIKDLINLKKQAKVFGFLMAFYVFLAIAMENAAMFGGIITILFAILPITALSYDERARWDKYALTMPISRQDLVIGKYLLGGIFMGLAFLIYLMFGLITRMETPFNVLLISAALMGVGLVFLAILLPILFKWGVEKGRFLMIAVLAVPTAAIVVASKLGITPPSERMLHTVAFLSPFIVLIILAGSIFLSVRVYMNKEF
jgi:ABC-type transport system involved in multi-copper enzyme maturation permease subunit